jgi:O-antigen ligase
MTLSLRTVGKYFAFFLFLVMVFRTFGEIFIIVTSGVLAVLLAGLVLARTLRISFTAVVIYLFLFFGVINFILGASLYNLIFPFSLPFFPLFLMHYFNKIGEKIPGVFPFFIMLAGFLVSVIYQTIHYGGMYESSVFGDQWFIFEFIFFFVLYMLFSLRILSLWKVIAVITVSVVPEIVFIFLKYIFTGQFDNLFHERFGSSVDITANQMAVWLDITFPLALFIGLYDKRPRIKMTFLIIALLYGAILLLTASRASMIGLPLVPFFIAYSTKSTSLRVAVVVVSLVAMGIFGRGVFQRTVLPNRLDRISTIGRTELLKTGYVVLKANHFFFGIGMDNYKNEKYNYGFMKSFDTQSGMSTHNAFLEIWLGWGLIGFLGWLVFLGQCVLRTARARLRPEMAHLKPALLLAFACTMIHSLFDSTIACFPFMIFFFTICACMCHLCKSKEVCRPLTDNKVPIGGITPPHAAVP